MAQFPGQGGGSALRRLRQWWADLPTGRRLNVALYALGGVAVVFMVITLLGPGEPETGQVAAGATTSTPPSAAPSTTVNRATTPTTASSTTQGPTTLRVTTTTTRPSAGGGGTTTTLPPVTVSTTTAPPACLNSADPACGPFRWDPPPQANADLVVQVTNTANPQVGVAVGFLVRADDPDHLVDANCAEVSFGDGSEPFRAPCPHRPICPPHFGPWTPPAPLAGSYRPIQPLAEHVYGVPGHYTVTVRMYSYSSDRCAELDPYSSAAEASVPFRVDAPPTSTSTTTTSSTTTTTVP